ncbi:CAP domain-containing protein [Streptomyces sp. H10-C2]|uniref:CAP domain-containing protein n=1 Tax=unclassified Streptomyces TaxID=2593676 RepID=UPI0024BBB8C9|nr:MULTISPECIES: CAP domain-containing protein [unclassified Streptomyces]MDJ0341703.1 CAP domain-containing protein [Streptomyces sp. PH10-H1]MDJ0368989.1 CAP domain-containing protein [Streptomyces sp. H10-C2]
MGRHSRTVAETATPQRGHRGRRRPHSPVRTGLLASSAALAVGAVAMSSGLLPSLNGPSGGLGQRDNAASRTQTDGSSGPSVTDAGSPTPQTGGRTTAPTSRGGTRSSAPTTAPTTSATATGITPSPKVTPSRTTAAPSTSPAATQTHTPTTTPTQDGSTTAAKAAVLSLVNAERAKVGCSPVATDASLAKLAQAFSQDMAARDFFDHTDPDGSTPWDRAKAARITNLGGENIARGQADAAAVMSAWMNSPGHRANILNCDYKTLGVGVHFASGGPWWTQDFGF